MSLEATVNQDSLPDYGQVSGYFRHFGFKRDPFGAEEKEGNFYLLPNWEQQIDLMLHYIRHENVLLTLTGPKGIGKTTLINFFLLEAIHGFSPTETAVQSDLISGEFLVQLGDTVRTCQVMADSALNPEQMLEAMAGAFDISTEHFLGSFENQADILLDNLQHSKQGCVILIDDANELPDSTLELLLYMVSQQSENQHRFHVVLIGESELKKRLAKISKTKDYHGLTYAIELEALNLAQTEYYLKHRFTAAGLNDEMVFSSGVISKIYKLSGGVPKIINQLARQSLFDMLKKKRFSSIGALFKPYKKTFIGGGFLLAGFAIILLYLGQDVKLKSRHSKVVHQTVMQKNSIVLLDKPAASQLPQAPQRTIAVASSTTATSPQLQFSPQAEGLSSPAPGKRLTVLPQNELTPQSQVAVAAPKSIVETSSLIEPASTKATENAEVATPLMPTEKPAVIRLTNKAKPVTLSGDNFAKPLTTAKSVQNGASELKNVANYPQTLVEPVKEVPVSPDKPVIKPQFGKQAAYTKQLMKKDPSHYTLKFKEMMSESAVKAFIAKYKLGSNVAYYHAKIDGVDRYVMVYGEYANSQTAKQAILLLPKSLGQLKPEPYRVGLVQKIVRDGI